MSKVAVHRTAYDRSAARIGVVHLGYGAFHRAHQAVYLDDYMEATGDLAWGIAAVNLRAEDSAGFAAAQKAEDGYLVKTMAPDGTRAYRMARPHVAFADWADNAERAEKLLALESVHVATVTVTESGYCLGDGGTLDMSHPAVARELNGGGKGTVYAYLGRALGRRMEGGGQPITVLCCDNIRANGRVLRQGLLDYLDALGQQETADWTRENVAFPCSMVDRITPRSSDSLAREATEIFPQREVSPVHAEDYMQWVVEDRMAGLFPDLGRCGVQIVDSVDPYEEAKIRILNGGHTGLAYMGALAGHDTFDQIMEDSRLRRHIDGWEVEEVLPGITIDLPFDKREYWNSVAARFGNRGLADSLERICMDGWAKFPVFVRPTLESCLEQGIRPRFGCDSVASWYVYARRCHLGESRIPYHEPQLERLRPLLALGQEEAFARSRDLWGDLSDRHEDFAADVVSAIHRMEESWPV